MPTIISGDGTITGLTSTGISAAQTITSVPSSALPAGSVLQVVQATVTGGTVFSGTAYKATNLTSSITPKFATSKILITITGGDWDIQNGGYQTFGTIYRNSTNLGSGSNLSFTDCYTASTRSIFPVILQYLDSPATTSSTTYTLYFNSGGGSNVVQYNTQGSTGVITLMEIAG
jgi:hypothetical protein